MTATYFAKRESPKLLDSKSQCSQSDMMPKMLSEDYIVLSGVLNDIQEANVGAWLIHIEIPCLFCGYPNIYCKTLPEL